MPSRHIDDGKTIYSFTHRFLVRCPRCDRCAQVARIGDSFLKSPGQLTCTHCGHAKEGRASGWSDNVPRDWYFKFPLWLQTPCCGNILWAFNLEHLAWLESYIEADHRIGLSDDDAERLGFRNGTLASRLPGWMIVAKHRTEVLRAIGTIRRMVISK